MTVQDALDEINKALHLKGAHAEFVTDQYLTEEMCNSNTPHNLMSQSFDWRYDFVKPTKDEYTVKLTVDDIRYIGNAIEVYEKFLFGRFIKPSLNTIIKKMGEENG